MNVVATEYEVNWYSQDEIKNGIRSQIVLSIGMGLPESLEMFPSDHISKFTI